MKKVLVVHYSQSGQLTEILNNILLPFKASDSVELTHFKIEMEEDFPFPWTKDGFLDAFPESVLQIPSNIKPLPVSITSTKYDLIILGYQVWYLSPSIPFNTFLNVPEVASLLKDTPVITVLGCRNMWVMAQEKVKKKLKALGASLVGNIVLVDRHPNHISVITIVKWMFSGVKRKYLGIFPKPGVSDRDIKESSKFGSTILSTLECGCYEHLQSDLLKKEAVTIKPFLVLADKRANILFAKWAKFIRSKGVAGDKKRSPFLKMFKFYLLFAIWVIAPIVFILFLLTYLPFMGRINQQKKYYSSIECK